MFMKENKTKKANSPNIDKANFNNNNIVWKIKHQQKQIVTFTNIRNHWTKEDIERRLFKPHE